MTTRTRREMVQFTRSFRLAGVDRELPPATYEIIVDEEMIEGLSFPAFRRNATMIMVPAAGRSASMEMISTSPDELDRARGSQADPPGE
jgi:hypothetical protein